MDMKDDNETHSLDTWTPLGKAASELLSKLRCQAQPESKLRDQAQQNMHASPKLESDGKPAEPKSDVSLKRRSTRFFKCVTNSR
jgi:hypothetical protein